jgi:hypothetical protein
MVQVTRFTFDILQIERLFSPSSRLWNDDGHKTREGCDRNSPVCRESRNQQRGQALTDILAWSASSASWQRDALRELDLEDQIDLDALLQLCKGLSKSGVPLASEHTRDAKAAPELSSCTRSTALRMSMCSRKENSSPSINQA